MRERPVRERCRRRVHERVALAENAAPAAAAVALCVGGDHPAPRQVAAKRGDRDGVRDRVLGMLNHVRGNLLVA